MTLAGCARVGLLENAGPVTPAPQRLRTTSDRAPSPLAPSVTPLFGDTAIGLVPGTGDTTIRYLGRLRDGFTADTLNILLCGDNRPGYRMDDLRPEFTALRQMLTPDPVRFIKGLTAIPFLLAKGLYPDLQLITEMPNVVRKTPKWGREQQVVDAMLATVDTLHSRKQRVAAVINSGDLVKDGRYPEHWKRFLEIVRPLSSRVPYFPVAGNHERTDTEVGMANWRTATGLPVAKGRLYYCFDSADGWVRFIALDSNPIVDAGHHWTREAQVAYSDEQFTWLVNRVKEHRGPVLVMLHHPPFSAAWHRYEWQRDAVLVARRERMMRALKEAGISIIVAGHEHNYQRALLTWPDAVVIAVVSGGGGSPLHALPPPVESAQLFAEYKVAGSVVKPENVYTSEVFNYSLVRLWFGGGELFSYAVDEGGQATLIDNVKIDLSRYGVPEIDQFKRPIAPSRGPREPTRVAAERDTSEGERDSVEASRRVLTSPPTGGRRRR